MSWRKVMLSGLVMTLGVMVETACAQDQDYSFARWVDAFHTRAIAEGIAPSIADDALGGITLDAKVIALDQKQPEDQITLDEYLAKTINDRRVRTGRAKLHEHAALLKRIAAQYHVQPEYIVALWGIESDYGAHKGHFSVVQSLATLAFEGRRADFFSSELIAALRIIQQERIAPDELTGSWAGAMGDCQFIPSTYLKYAADGDRDGHRNIWTNPADIFASTANYLHQLGWNDRIGWGEPVRAPDDVQSSELDIKHAQPASYWTKRGFAGSDGNGRTHGFGEGNTPLYGIKVGEGENYYIVTENYQALLQWNRSRYFATAVGTLADRIAGRQ